MTTNTNETPGDYLRRTLKDKDAMLEVARLATEDQREAMTHNTRNTGAEKGTSGINLKGSTGASGNSPSAYGSAERPMTDNTEVEQYWDEVHDCYMLTKQDMETYTAHQLQKALEVQAIQIREEEANEYNKIIECELQKARHDWLREEIVKLEGMKKETSMTYTHQCPSDCCVLGNDHTHEETVTVPSAVIYNQALQAIIDRYLLEFDGIAQK